MLIKLFKQGRGKGAGPVEYTTKEVVPAFDEKGRRIKGQTKTRIPPPEVLRGDPQRTEMLIDSSSNAWKYSSGVLAFGDTDTPTDDEIEDLIDDFEQTFFAGLESDQYDVLWVRHTHEGNTELHFVIPRLELATGKALNPFPPGYIAMSDAWRDKWNWSKGWERPDDPERARVVKRPDHILKIDPTAEDPRTDLTEWLVSRIQAGLIEDRTGILASLQEIGTITRQGKDYISVKPEGFDKPVRLKGAIYGSDFKREQLEEAIAREDAARSAREPAISLERAAEATERLAKHVQKRAQYNADRYPRESEIPFGGYGDADGPGSPDRREDGRTAPGEAEQDHAQPLLPGVEGDQSTDRPGDSKHQRTDIELERSENSIKRDNESSRAISESQPQALDNGFGSGPERLSDYLRRELGSDSIFEQRSTAEPRNDQRAKANDQRTEQQNPRLTDHRSAERDVLDTPAKRSHWLQRWRQASDQIINELREGYERVRATVNTGIERIERAIQDGYDAARRSEQVSSSAGQQLDAAGGSLGRAAQSLGTLLEKLDRGGFGSVVEAIKQRLTDSELPAKADSPARFEAVQAPAALPEPRRWARPKG